VSNEEKLLEDLEKKAGVSKIIVLHIVRRTSEGYYNYKTSGILVFYKPNYEVKYENSDVRDVNIVNIYAGVYQEYDYNELISVATRRGWHVIEFES